MNIRLEPLGRTVSVASGVPLRDVLFPFGVEFPCGGKARCRRCRIKVLEGALPVTAADEAALTPAQIADGYRLSCHAAPAGDLTLEIAQWSAAILADETPFVFTPRQGLGVAVDVGTTTLVAQLLDLATGRVLGVRSALNPQVVHGADVMSRIEFAVTQGGQRRLEALIREAVGGMVEELAEGRALADLAIVGNTVMHHLFCGIDVEPLAHAPFQTSRDGPVELELGGRRARFLPCLGGFVGSDILAGVLAARLHENDGLVALLDLGTNGEIIAGNRHGLVCASTAAGPAFEGGRIEMGMRAATGAISEVTAVEGRLECSVIGHVPPRGICGSGLVDAVAAALDLGLVLPSGRLAGAKSLPLTAPVVLTQRDIRELQLAKAATAAGLELVLRQFGATPAALDRLYLAGAFGNYLNRASAQRIGLLNLPLDKVEPAGNTALLGAKLALFNGGDYAPLRSRIRHLPLAADAEFQERYVEAMAFPEAESQKAKVDK